MASGEKKGDAAAQPAALAKSLADAISGCSSEEDLRLNVEHALRNALDLPPGKYEESIKTSTFTGQADAVHQRVLIEYKKPQKMRSPKVRSDAIDQLCGYLEAKSLSEEAHKPDDSDKAYTQEQEERLSGVVGIATDGERFIFVQRRSKQWFTDERKLNSDTVEKLCLWLRAMQRKDLSPENLLADFGPQSDHARDVVRVLAELVASAKHPKANVIFEEWSQIFGIVYGTEPFKKTQKAKETQALSSAYHLTIGVDFPILLFSVHTYYALLMKLLATEVIVAQGVFGDSFLGTLKRSSLRTQLDELESGAILQQKNIRNAIEQDFFGWYPEAWTPDLHKVLWNFIKTLAAYDIGTFEIKPDRTRDLLKDLYHGLIPETVRHALGEYYTPDWLAEHTIDLSGYDGDPNERFLDPACGSGTFLVLAIQEIRQWLSDNSVEWGTNDKKAEAVELIRHNVVGFDLNPLAVIASRTNYLFALGPLLQYRKSGAAFEIPVYLTDSVLLPGHAQDQLGLFVQDTVPFPMTVGTFDLPAEAVHQHKVPDLMNLLHEAIAEGHSRAVFVETAIDTLPLTSSGAQTSALETLFNAMKKLLGERPKAAIHEHLKSGHRAGSRPGR